MEIRHLRRALKNGGEFGNMFSKTPEMHRLFETIRMVASTDMAVVIEGETGTGKDLLANAVHYHSARRDGPFVTINCAGLPDHLLEHEIFGHENGAGSPAQPGKIELAHGGSLFLDEVEGLSIALQGKLLNVIEERKFQRTGSHVSAPVDVRVITATSVPLKRLVAEGKMRSDFYYRITVIPIRLLPLRQRSVDIDLPKADWEMNPTNLGSTTLARWLDEKEKQFLAQKLEDCGGNINVTARTCGIGLRSLHRKMQKYGLDKKRYKHRSTEPPDSIKPATEATM